MSVDKNFPEIRFKGFSEPWVEEKIQELIDRQAITSHLDGNHGELYPRANEFSNSGIPYISANDFVSGFMSFSGCKYLPTQRAMQFKKGIAKDGDILFAHNATVGPVAKLNTSYDFVILSTTATYFRCDNDSLINDYLLQALSNKKFIQQYSRVMAQSTRNQVPITVQRKFSIPIPENSSEQNQIGNYFQKLDNLINQHQQKHDKLSSIKKSMLEKMFPKKGETVPEIRFKGFSGEWEETTLGNLCLIGDIDHRMPESKINGIPYLMTGDFTGINGLDFENAKLISHEDYEQLSKKIKPESGDIIFARYASVGAVRYVETEIKFLVSYSCAILKTSNKSYGRYLFYRLQTGRSKNQIELDINTGSQRNIGIDSLKNMAMNLPNPNEQTRIGNYFQKLDSLISQHQQQITKLNNIKQACLSKMFV